jgi:hypothetical protein
LQRLRARIFTKKVLAETVQSALSPARIRETSANKSGQLLRRMNLKNLGSKLRAFTPLKMMDESCGNCLKGA